jgi:hypothetical protein
MAQPAVIEETAPTPSEPLPIAPVAAPPLADNAAPTPAAPSTSSLNAVCRSCGAKLESGTSFCTTCGLPTSGSDAVIAAPAVSVLPQNPRAIESASVEPARASVAADTAVVPPIYATPTDYSPAQPGGGAFRTVVLILLLVIVAGAFGGWYFWGVETVIVCSPPDVRVFLDDKELQPSSYGRYVVPHLSRQTHLLKVQRPGFADTIQKLDFPMTSAHEWVNVTLVPSRRLQR